MTRKPISARPHSFFVRPAPGWLDVVSEEVQAVLQTPLQKYKFEPKVVQLKSTVKVSHCDWRQGLELPLRLLTAHDVEWVVCDEKCRNLGDAKTILSEISWKEIIPEELKEAHVSASSPELRNFWCEHTQLKHVSEGASFRIKIEYHKGFLKAIVSLAGAPLYQRGYKAALSAVAPLPEHQAAAIVRWTMEWSAQPITNVFIPFAGSGTFGFETLLNLSGFGLGGLKRKFSFESFPCTPPKTLEFIKKKLQGSHSELSLPKVQFCEFNPTQVEALKKNVRSFPLKAEFQIDEGDFFESKESLEEKSEVLILLNPPFGNRLGRASSVTALYSKIAKKIRTQFFNRSNGVGCCICPDEKTWSLFLRDLGSSKQETHHFTHGGKQMRLVRWRWGS